MQYRYDFFAEYHCDIKVYPYLCSPEREYL
nr:MAG TPA: hypothetical protein [Caudoviricetes sp.]